MIIEPKETNSGTPQGTFLSRQMVLKQDGKTPYQPTDFRVGLDVGIYGKIIRITDCDQYTREFFQVRYSIFYSKLTYYFRILARDNLTHFKFPLIASLRLKQRSLLRRMLR